MWRRELPLTSVIIPTFNRAYCLERTIDSVLAQTCSDLEVIVVDDGSTDNTEALVRTRYADEKRVVYLHQANRGVAGARNTGFAVARGDFIALLDSDDVWMPWKLEVQIACLQRLPEIGMIWSDMEAVNPDGEVFDHKYIRNMYSTFRMYTMKELFSRQCKLHEVASFTPSLRAMIGDANFYSGYIFSQMVMGSLVHTSTAVLRRERLEKVGGFNEELKFSGEDFDFHLRTCRVGLVGFVDLSTIRYQRGMADALTRPENRVHVANNFLKTILPIIKNNRNEIKLPDDDIRATLADAYNWLGEAQLDSGDIKAARQNIWKSLQYKLRQPRIFTPLISAYLPKSALAFLRRLKQKVKAGWK
jgi:glycosyltransferase involved in cell wall biosynthesis